MNPAESPVPAAHFHHPVRVYWEDTDAGGIVFYANYLKFFERARTEWLRALGHSQQEMVDATGCMFVVQDTHRALRPPGAARRHAGDHGRREGTRQARACASPNRPGAASTLLAEGDIRIGCVARATMKPHRIPGPIFEAIE